MSERKDPVGVARAVADALGAARGRVVVVRTPSGPLSVLRPVAEALLAQGVLSGQLDGDLHAADAATVKAALLTGAGVCDFCSAPGATHVFDVPDFDMPGLPGHRSTEGWAACDDCATLVRADKRQALLERSLERMAFAKFTRPAIAELQQRFWRGMDQKVDVAAAAAALVDYINDALPADVAQPALTQRTQRIERVRRITGLSDEQLTAVAAGRLDADAGQKMLAFAQRFHGQPGSLRAVTARLVDGPVKPLPDIQPHWQRALDGRFAALTQLALAVKKLDERRAEHFREVADLKDPAAIQRMVEAAQKRQTLRDMGFGEDVKALRVAQAYSFNADTMAAIRAAAASLPHDAPLSSIETPNTGAGWFWFAEPFPVTASPLASERVNALLWAWVDGYGGIREVQLTDEVMARMLPGDRERLSALAGAGRTVSSGELAQVADALKRAGVSREEFARMTNPEAHSQPALMFSAYVVDEKGQLGLTGAPAPSTRWYWPLALTFHDMLVYNADSWTSKYGPGGAFADEPHIMGKDATLKCVADLSLFFAMACVWFKQTVPASGRVAKPPVLTQESGHVERHARKRYVRDHKLKAPPTVQVVALRKSARVAAESEAAGDVGAAAKREYHCRWIVQGHPRLQPCGPGRMDKKMIWIESYPKGPEGKPFRQRERVYAVIR